MPPNKEDLERLQRAIEDLCVKLNFPPGLGRPPLGGRGLEDILGALALSGVMTGGPGGTGLPPGLLLALLGAGRGGGGLGHGALLGLLLCCSQGGWAQSGCCMPQTTCGCQGTYVQPPAIPGQPAGTCGPTPPPPGGPPTWWPLVLLLLALEPGLLERCRVHEPRVPLSREDAG